MRAVVVPILSLLLVPAACTVGDLGGPGSDDEIGDDDDGNGDDDLGASPDAGVVRSTSLTVGMALAELNLGETAEIPVAVTSSNYEGPVTLSLAGAPPQWQVSFSPDTLNFTTSSTLQSTLTVTIPPSAVAEVVPTMVNADSDVDSHENSLSVAVSNLYEIGIADNTGAGGAHVWPEVDLRSGTIVRFTNYDTTIAHRIHADGGPNFPHEDDQMAAAPAPGEAGGTYDVVTSTPGSYSFYCHDHGQNTGTGLVTVTSVE